MFDSTFNESSNDMNPGPVSTMNDDIPFAFKRSKLFSIVINNVPLSNGGTKIIKGLHLGSHGFFVCILDL